MNQLLSKIKVKEKYCGKIIGFFTVVAAIVTIIAYIFPKPDKNIENIRELLEAQNEITLFSNRTEIRDSVFNTNPALKETSKLQSEIEQYFRVCDRLNFPAEKDMTDETKEIVCIQNLKILIELEDITQNINNTIQNLILLDPSVTTYLDIAGLDKVNKTNKQLNEALNEVYEKIASLSNDRKKIKIIWKFFNSNELYPALKSKKDVYASLFKSCETLINKQNNLNSSES